MKKTQAFLDKKGSVLDVLFIVAIVFTFAIGFLVIHFATNTAVDNMLNAPAINDTKETRESLEGVKETTDRFDYLVLGVFIALTLGLLITGWLVGGHPIFMVLYFIVLIFAVIISAFLSNIWESVSVASVFGSTINSFAITNNLLLNLPVYAAIIGFLGLIVMFAKPFLQEAAPP